jgi:septum formation protein
LTRFVLASSSPRRRQLLASIGLQFDVIPSAVPEELRPGEMAEEYVIRLSRQKAAAVADANHDRWIIAADTIVVLGDQILEKPRDAADAKRMLGAIAGQTHVVYTGVTVKCLQKNYADTHVAASEVRMLPLNTKEIDWYVATGEPLDKAGAYAAQGVGALFIESIHGSYTNVVGLPLALLFQMLRRAGLNPLQSSC